MSPSKHTTLKWNIAGEGESQYITVYVPGRDPLSCDQDHPHFAKIVAGAAAGDVKVADLFDIARTVKEKFLPLSDRVAVRHGRVYFDDDEQDSSITKKIIAYLDDDKDDWKPLVAFMDKVAQNPSENSRKQLFTWLDAHKFDITPEGFIRAYKGVARTSQSGYKYESGNAGAAYVNGTFYKGKIPQNVGDTVTMPRSGCTDNERQACATGLHVGTREQARRFASGALLEVLVNPRDVVSVPTGAAKVRVCRYMILKVAS